eukprot:748067-Hanusia_phi.AAC.1
MGTLLRKKLVEDVGRRKQGSRKSTRQLATERAMAEADDAVRTHLACRLDKVAGSSHYKPSGSFPSSTRRGASPSGDGGSC